jgi:hypothetical protein
MLSNFWSFLQLSLYPALDEHLSDPLSESERQLVALLEFMSIEQYIDGCSHHGAGRPRHERSCLIRAFVVKTFFGYSTTKRLRDALIAGPGLRLICGFANPWRVPSLSTFSRAFSEFAAAGLGDKCHQALVKTHVGELLVLHNSRDSTALPRNCGVGRKPNSQGNLQTWIGYKVHVDWLDGMIAANVETTSASVNDCALAIPMMRKTAQRVPHIAYQLMDAAYDAIAVRKAALDLDQTAIIQGQAWKKKYTPFDTAQKKRFCQRTNAERAFSRLKDEFGLCDFRVRGHPKVHLHVMISILLLFADQMLRPVTH